MPEETPNPFLTAVTSLFTNELIFEAMKARFNKRKKGAPNIDAQGNVIDFPEFSPDICLIEWQNYVKEQVLGLGELVKAVKQEELLATSAPDDFIKSIIPEEVFTPSE